MRYAVTPSGNAVYSVGKDGNDDGGVWTDADDEQDGAGTDIGVLIRRADLPGDGQKRPTHGDVTAGEAGSRVTTDPADYVAVVQAIWTKGLPDAVRHLPQAIPSSATSVKLRYHPPTFRDRSYLRSPLYVELRFALDKADFEAVCDRLSPQRPRKIGRKPATVSRIVPEGFDIVLLDSSGDSLGRGISHGAATKDETREVFFWSYGHSWPPM